MEEPLPVKGWAGVRPAKEFGALCAQKANPIIRDATETREDCLFLNVWAPQWPSRPRTPVMVWIPGGGNFALGSSLPPLDGERLARRGIVLVTLNYRLGAFGFFSTRPCRASPRTTRPGIKAFSIKSRRSSGSAPISRGLAAIRRT